MKLLKLFCYAVQISVSTMAMSTHKARCGMMAVTILASVPMPIMECILVVTSKLFDALDLVLIHLWQASSKRALGKQCRPRFCSI